MSTPKEQNRTNLEKEQTARDAAREAYWLKSARTSSEQNILDAGRKPVKAVAKK